MKINIAAPTTGQQKVIEIDDEKRLQNLYDRRVSQEVDGDVLGEEFAGYVFRVSGGNDKQMQSLITYFQNASMIQHLNLVFGGEFKELIQNGSSEF